jgi:hypothetical protein
MPRPNASIVLSGRDRNTPTPRNYNAAVFSQTNQNIVQGQIYSIAVSEVNFPYDIPNMQNGFNMFEAESEGMTPAQRFEVAVAPGFYTGTELVAAINASFLAAAQVINPALIAANVPAFSYDQTSNRVFVANPATPVVGYTMWTLYSSYTFYSTLSPNRTQVGKDIFSIMGFTQAQGSTGVGGVGNNPLILDALPIGSAISAPLVFTQYIDICSPQLCKFQYFRDGSTTNLARRVDIICRLYIANNVALSVGNEDGTRPFLINRQYQNARVMRWTADNAVGQIDINLYDDVGQPLLTSWEPRPYQITFLAYEADDRSEKGSGDALENLLKKYAPYQAINEKAWSSPSFPLSRR